MFSLQDRAIAVTGAGSGIGRACAVRLARAGARVAVLDRDPDAARETADLVSGLAVPVDVADSDAMAAAFAEIGNTWPRLHGLVNNAGIALPGRTIAETGPDHFLRHQEVNALGVLNGIRHGAPLMTDGGAVVNTSSVLGLFAIPGYASYAASKHAVIGLTQVAAVELGPRRIRVNAVCPTTVDTPMLTSFPAGAQEAAVLGEASALGGIVQAEHVAALVHFLLTDDCPVLTGLAVPVDKGIGAGVSQATWDRGLPA